MLSGEGVTTRRGAEEEQAAWISSAVMEEQLYRQGTFQQLQVPWIALKDDINNLVTSW